MPDDQWVDPIVDEVRRARDEHAASFNYDLKAICADLRRRQGQLDREVISLPPKRAEPPTEGAA